MKEITVMRLKNVMGNQIQYQVLITIVMPKIWTRSMIYVQENGDTHQTGPEEALKQ